MAFAMTLQRSDQRNSQPLFPAQNAAAFFLVTGLFFLWGIPGNLKDVLIRQFMASFAMIVPLGCYLCVASHAFWKYSIAPRFSQALLQD